MATLHLLPGARERGHKAEHMGDQREQIWPSGRLGNKKGLAGELFECPDILRKSLGQVLRAPGEPLEQL